MGERGRAEAGGRIGPPPGRRGVDQRLEAVPEVGTRGEGVVRRAVEDHVGIRRVHRERRLRGGRDGDLPVAARSGGAPAEDRPTCD